MATDRIVVRGIVRNGLVVPQTEAALPEGLQVEIVLSPADVSPQLREEFDLWERASDEAWAMIDQWEASGAQRKLGSLRGTVAYMAPDFDAPLDDPDRST